MVKKKKTKKTTRRKSNSNFSSGFTLVELLVASTVFVLFMAAITNIFILAQSSQRFLSKYSLVIDDLSFFLERAAREIRMGDNFTLSGDKLSFTNAYGQNVVYKLEHYKIQRSEDGGITFSPITSKDIKVKELKFVLSGQSKDDSLQPRITISVKFTSGEGRESEKYEKTVQTTISARQLDS